MRILLIATPRSGSTTFINWVSKELKLKVINEPFNNSQKNIKELQNHFYNSDNIIAKIAANETNHVEKKSWDYILGLTRETIEDCAISLTKALTENKTKYEWHTKYSIKEDWIVNNRNKINEMSDFIIKQNNLILNNKNIDFLLTYEDVYYNKIKIIDFCKKFNITNLNLLNPSKKYRVNMDVSKKLF